MAQRHPTFQVTAPARTLQAAPLEVATPFDPGIVRAIRLKIPRGHAGLTGIQFAVAHQPVIPETAGTYLLGDQDHHDIPVNGMPESGQWSVFVYNVDRRAHYWQVIFFVDTLPTRDSLPRARPTPLRVTDIYEAGYVVR